MKKPFIWACAISFILLFEHLNHLLVLIILTDFAPVEVISRAFAHTSITSVLFIGAFRIIPFVPLVLCAAFTNLLSSLKGKVALWLSLGMTVFIIFTGYWEIMRPLYTDEHASSTASIGYIFVPVVALSYAVAAGFAAYFIFYIAEIISKRK